MAPVSGSGSDYLRTCEVRTAAQLSTCESVMNKTLSAAEEIEWYGPSELTSFKMLYDLMPKSPETGLLVVELFVDFMKALAVVCDEKNAGLQMQARARRQLAGKEELTLQTFADCLRGTLWTRIEKKVHRASRTQSAAVLIIWMCNSNHLVGTFNTVILCQPFKITWFQSCITATLLRTSCMQYVVDLEQLL